MLDARYSIEWLKIIKSLNIKSRIGYQESRIDKKDTGFKMKNIGFTFENTECRVLADSMLTFEPSILISPNPASNLN
jgi:hypothetical protein